MASLFGVDVSEFNGNIDWVTVKDEIDFAIIRGGYGSSNVDLKFVRNADGCTQNNIPFGVYWFSYALSVQDCIDEANYCCSLLANFNLSLPVFYDWEDDSDRYAQQQGVVMTNQMRELFAKAFMDTVINNGYVAGLYSNPNYINYMGMGFILNQTTYKLWLADWSSSTSIQGYDIWQYGQGYVNGIPTITDLNTTDSIPPIPPHIRKKYKWWIYNRFVPY